MWRTFVLLEILTASVQLALQAQEFTPEHESVLNLAQVPNHFVKLLFTHAYGGLTDINLIVEPPPDSGIIVVIREMLLRKGVPHIGGRKCYEYVEFTELTKKGNQTSFACGTLSLDKNEIVGSRSIQTGINNSLSISVHFSNEDFRQTTSRENETMSSNSTFILDITGYAACPSYQDPSLFKCSAKICIPNELRCDANFNCHAKPRVSMDISRDELNCTEPSIGNFAVMVGNNNIAGGSAAPSLEVPDQLTTTRKPTLVSIISPLWPWNWHRKNKTSTPTSTTTTPNPVFAWTFGDDVNKKPEDTDTVAWARELPMLSALFIFIGVTCLLFSVCSLLAKVTTKRQAQRILRQSLQHRSTTSGSQRLQSRTAGFNAGENEGSNVFIYPVSNTTIYVNSSNSYRNGPPPKYEENSPGSEPPPAYSVLFRKPSAHPDRTEPLIDTASGGSPTS